VEDLTPVTLLVGLAGGLVLDHAAFFVAAVMSTLLFAILRQQFFRVHFLLQGLVEQRCGVRHAEVHRPSGKRGVAGHLVVFDRLAGCDDVPRCCLRRSDQRPRARPAIRGSGERRGRHYPRALCLSRDRRAQTFGVGRLSRGPGSSIQCR
jgi:hypothetical protein